MYRLCMYLVTDGGCYVHFVHLHTITVAFHLHHISTVAFHNRFRDPFTWSRRRQVAGEPPARWPCNSLLSLPIAAVPARAVVPRGPAPPPARRHGPSADLAAPCPLHRNPRASTASAPPWPHALGRDCASRLSLVRLFAARAVLCYFVKQKRKEKGREAE
jgi:hypothetical protein